MQFKVPQFLEIEDKIFGPFTFKEFIYLVGGGGMCFVIYKLLGLFWGAIPILLVGGFACMLTFYRPNNKPFLNMIEAGFNFTLQSKLYIWKKRKIKNDTKSTSNIVSEDKNSAMAESGMRLSGNKLRDLAWSLDVLDLKKEGN